MKSFYVSKYAAVSVLERPMDSAHKIKYLKTSNFHTGKKRSNIPRSKTWGKSPDVSNQ